MLSAGNTCFMNANLQMLLHAPPVQATLCSMPVPGPETDGPPTPKAEEALRNSGPPSLVPESSAAGEQKTELRDSSMPAEAIQKQAQAEVLQKETEAGIQDLGSSTCMAAAGCKAMASPNQEPAAADSADCAPCSCSPGCEILALAPIAEHAKPAKSSPAAELTQAEGPGGSGSASVGSLPFMVSVRTCAEDAGPMGDADSDSSRSQTPASHMGVATPEIAHPPSAVEYLQRGHHPWAAGEAPAAVLREGVASTGTNASSAAAPSNDESAGAEAKTPAEVAPQVAGQAECADAQQCPAGIGTSECDRNASVALPPPAALPELKPGELFRTFRRFAHEVWAFHFRIDTRPRWHVRNCNQNLSWHIAFIEIKNGEVLSPLSGALGTANTEKRLIVVTKIVLRRR